MEPTDIIDNTIEELEGAMVQIVNDEVALALATLYELTEDLRQYRIHH